MQPSQIDGVDMHLFGHATIENTHLALKGMPFQAADMHYILQLTIYSLWRAYQLFRITRKRINLRS